MELFPYQYYHLYNRSNNDEIVFKSSENYLYFLKKYRHYLSDLIDTIAYCLMPTHFHFLIYIKSEDIEFIQKQIGVLLSSYTKAINKKWNRHGSLFQQHTKAKHIKDETYLLTALVYIHQNPVYCKIVNKLEDWEFSSYRDFIGLRNGTLNKREIIRSRFNNTQDFIEFSNRPITDLNRSYL